VSLEKAGATELAKALDEATGKVLENGKSPSRKVGELDNRGSHFYLALYWAQALGDELAERLAADEEAIIAELNGVQGESVDLGGYYFVDRDKATAVMRPSATFNDAIGSQSPSGRT
jgi:isocitrate dehydrogenase